MTRKRPSAVVVTTPPVFAPMVAWAWCALHRVPLVVDCHTGAFRDPRWRWARPLHRLFLKRALAALAHTDADKELLGEWGVPAILLPDDLPGPTDALMLPRSTRLPRVLVAGSFDQTEPVAAVMAAARLVPHLELRLTGDPRRLTSGLRRRTPRNIVLTGYLDYPRFLGEMLAADVVAVFSEEANTMSRAAFEAVGLGRPLVASNQPGLRERFGPAGLFTANRPEAIAAALRQAVARGPDLAQRSRSLRDALQAQRELAMRELRARLADSGARAGNRVLVVSGYPFPDHVVLRNVRSLLAAGATVDVICPWISNLVAVGREGASGLRVFRLPVFHKRSRLAWYVFEYLSLLALAGPLVSALGLRHRYRSVEVYNSTDLAVFTAIVPRLRGSRVVLNMLEMNPELAATRLRAGPGHPLVRLLRLCERLATGWADCVVTVSGTWRRLLIERGADPDRIVVVPNTQRVPALRSRRAAARSPILVSHGVQIERYGLQTAIQVLPRLLEHWPDLRLELIGGGEYQPELRRLADRLGVGGQVDFLGFIPSWQEALGRVSRATIGLVPVLDDGYGHLILPTRLVDYAALGIPAVCSRLPAMREYFPEDAVSYFEPGDGAELAARVLELLRNPGLARKQAQKAAAALTPIGWEHVSDRYLAALGQGGGDALPEAA